MFARDNVKNEAILRDFLIFRSWQHQKRSNSATLLRFLNWTTSKTKQFCETSLIFEFDNIKNKWILRDFLQKCKVECRADSLIPLRFAIFPLHLSKVLRLPRKIDARSYDMLHLSRKIILANLQIWCSKMQSLLRKSAPWPPNISDEHVFCTAPATRNASLKILFKCPTPAIVFGNATKPSRFAHFWQGAQSLAPATRKHIWTSKSAPYPSGFYTFDFEMCFAPQRRALFRHLNFQKWSVHGVVCAFWLGNVLRATTACTFSTSQLPKVVRTLCVLCILEMCFAPQRRAIFHLSSGQMAPHPPLQRAYVSTLRSHKSLEKHSGSRLSYLFAHLHLLSFDSFSSLIFSLLLFSSLWLFPSLLFICPYCRKFDF